MAHGGFAAQAPERGQEADGLEGGAAGQDVSERRCGRDGDEDSGERERGEHDQDGDAEGGAENRFGDEVGAKSAQHDGHAAFACHQYGGQDEELVVRAGLGDGEAGQGCDHRAGGPGGPQADAVDDEAAAGDHDEETAAAADQITPTAALE